MQGWARRKITYSIATTKATNGSKKNRGIADETNPFATPEATQYNILIKADGTQVPITESECENYRLVNSVPVSSMDTIYYYQE